MDRGGRNPDDILLCGSESIVFCKVMSRSTELRYIKLCYLGDHVVLAAESLQKMGANRVVVLVLRFFRLPERELVATGRAMATILRDPKT
jgi:hypothetical protein